MSMICSEYWKRLRFLFIIFDTFGIFFKGLIYVPQNLKGHGDAQTYDSANIEFLDDFYIFYIFIYHMKDTL